MQSLRRLVLIALTGLAAAALAQSDVYATAEAAIAGLFPGKKYDEWVATVGDFNADGVTDRAMILTHSPEDGPLEVRLVVLAGVRAGGFSALSVSSTYCVAQKFFNLDAKGSSLFVAEVNHADSNGMGSNTLQFRFNPKLGDFELVGGEMLSESVEDDSGYERHSVNYLSGVAVSYAKVRGRVRETKRERFAVAPLMRLGGFECDRYIETALH